MGKGLIFVLGFLVGGAGAGLLANTILKQKYGQEADEQIASCREAFLNELDKRREEAKKEKETQEAAVKAIKAYSDEPEKAAEVIEKANEPSVKKPYEITEDVFDDESKPHKSKGLLYFPNEGVILREDHSIMSGDDVKCAIGMDALSKFDNDTDRVIMRNDTFMIDYDICMSSISFTEWKKRHPEAGK